MVASQSVQCCPHRPRAYSRESSGVAHAIISRASVSPISLRVHMGGNPAGKTHGQAPVARYGHRNEIHSTWTSVNMRGFCSHPADMRPPRGITAGPGTHILRPVQDKSWRTQTSRATTLRDGYTADTATDATSGDPRESTLPASQWAQTAALGRRSVVWHAGGATAAAWLLPWPPTAGSGRPRAPPPTSSTRSNLRADRSFSL